VQGLEAWAKRLAMGGMLKSAVARRLGGQEVAFGVASEVDSLNGEPVSCPRCGAQNLPGTVVCLACGAGVGTSAHPSAIRPETPGGIPPAAPRGRQTRRRSGGGISCLALLALAITAGLVIAFFLAPSTTITLFPDRQVLSEQVQVQASPAVRALDADKRQIPARVVTYEASGSGALAITKQKEVITGRAQGLVTFANRGDQPVVVPQGTIVASSNGAMRYETVEDVLVPGAVFATTKVGVRSLAEGPAGNTEKLVVARIEGSLSSLLYVANDSPLAGGDKRLVTYVTNEDRATLREQVLNKLKADAHGKLEVRIQQGEFVAPETIRVVNILEETYDRAVNEEATSLGLKMRVFFTSTFVDGQKANEVAQQALTKKVKPGYQLLPQSVQLTPKEVQRVEGDTVYFLIQAQGAAVAAFDEARIRGDLAGKTLAEAQLYLDSLPNQTERPKIEVFPGWLGRIARWDFRIYINVAPKAAGQP
jgi:hypothetical protein